MFESHSGGPDIRCSQAFHLRSSSGVTHRYHPSRGWWVLEEERVGNLSLVPRGRLSRSLTVVTTAVFIPCWQSQERPRAESGWRQLLSRVPVRTLRAGVAQRGDLALLLVVQVLGEVILFFPPVPQTALTCLASFDVRNR